MNIKKFLSNLFKPKPRIVIQHIPKRLNDQDLMKALAVEEDHSMYLALLEMIERAVEDAQITAKFGIDQKGTLAANLGAKFALEDLRNSLIQYRFNAVLEMRRRQCMGRD